MKLSWLKRLQFRLSGLIGPRMIYGFRRGDGTLLRRTRISNMSRIDCSDRLSIEDNVYIGHFNLLDASGGLRIGRGCQITNFVTILTHSSDTAIRLYGEAYLNHHEHIGYSRQPTEIGEYSFIGPHSVLMPGAYLGKGSLVYAYSFVPAGDYPDFAVLRGCPAKVVGDTRTRDAEWLLAYPQLQAFYAAWADE